MYIDKMLLNLPIDEVFHSSANPKLQEVMMKLRPSVEELEDNKEIFDWIVTMAGMIVFSERSQTANREEKFRTMVARLDGVRL